MENKREVPKYMQKKPTYRNKTLYMPEDLITAVESLANKTNTSFSQIVNGMVEECLEKIKDMK